MQPEATLFLLDALLRRRRLGPVRNRSCLRPSSSTLTSFSFSLLALPSLSRANPLVSQVSVETDTVPLVDDLPADDAVC